MALLATSGLVLFLIMFWKGRAEPTKQSRFALHVPVLNLVHFKVALRGMRGPGAMLVSLEMAYQLNKTVQGTVSP